MSKVNLTSESFYSSQYSNIFQMAARNLSPTLITDAPPHSPEQSLRKKEKRVAKAKQRVFNLKPMETDREIPEKDIP